MVTDEGKAARLATYIAFFVAGYGLACWAPLVPFAKLRLLVDEKSLGLLLLCLGVGSVAAMLGAGAFCAKFGSKPVVIAGGIGMSILLPVLAIAPTPIELGIGLALFGASLGSIEVAMNVHAIEVERAARRPLMSGFHALFSIGGFAGSTSMTILLTTHVGALGGTLICAGLMLVLMVITYPRLFRRVLGESGPLFVLPRGIVLLLATLAAITFLAEGAMLDWGAQLVTERRLVAAQRSGLGYMLFSLAMTAGRIFGDKLTGRLGDRRVIMAGSGLAIAGFAVLLTAAYSPLAFSGFVLVGLGASNVVPILFRGAGKQRRMPTPLAVAAITTVGYAGILVGPAAIGFVAQAVGLGNAFWMVAALFVLVLLSAPLVTRDAA